jgi:hypothetical protein
MENIEWEDQAPREKKPFREELLKMSSVFVFRKAVPNMQNEWESVQLQKGNSMIPLHTLIDSLS